MCKGRGGGGGGRCVGGGGGATSATHRSAVCDRRLNVCQTVDSSLVTCLSSLGMILRNMIEP